MNVLGIETSTTQASVAVSVAGIVTARVLAASAGSSSQVLPELMALLRETGLSMDEIDLITFGAGPGAFTGVRVACGLAQGLALGADIPVLPLCTLEAMAQTAFERHRATSVLSVLDARMNEIYAAWYRRDMTGWVEEFSPRLLAINDIPYQPDSTTSVVGNGVPLCASLQATKLQDSSIVPAADALVRLATTRAQRAVPAREAAPLYLRNKVAFTSDERAHGLHRPSALAIA